MTVQLACMFHSFGKQLNRSDFVGVRKRGRALKLTC